MVIVPGPHPARGEMQGILFPTALRTTSQATGNLVNEYGRMLQVIVDVTAVSGGGSITITINGYDPASGKSYALLASAPITAVGTYVYRIGPSLTPSPNVVSNDFVPLLWNVVVAANTAGPVTYSVGYALGA